MIPSELRIAHTIANKMGSIKVWIILVGIAGFLFLQPGPVSAQASQTQAIVGRVLDPQGQPVRGARVCLYLNDQSKAAVIGESNHDGVFFLEYTYRELSSIKLEVQHPHFKPHEWTARVEKGDALFHHSAFRVPDIEMHRRMSPGFWIAILVFGTVLFLIITERMHSTVAALLGAGLLLVVSLRGSPLGEQFFIFDLERAMSYVDFNVIFLVLGMMIIVGTIERTGVFQWIAYHSYRVSRGHLWLLVIILMLFTSIASALLDNVTTVLLVAPISIQIALTLGINPLSLLIPEMLVSNVGGIATLIGTPNNILIGSYAGLGFNDFIRDLTPGVLLVQVVITLYVIFIFRSQYRGGGETQSKELLDLLRENARITEPETLRNAGLVFLGTLVFFALGEQLHILPAVTAMISAAITLVVVGADVEDIFRVVDWATILFFITLFMIVGAIQEVGFIGIIAESLHKLVAGNQFVAILVVIWGTGLLCLAVPTIPLTAALLPVVGLLSQTIPDAGNVLYYGLSMGSALGANNSLIGATNNMVAAGIAKRAGYPISYRRFIRIGFPACILSLLVGTVYILVRF